MRWAGGRYGRKQCACGDGEVSKDLPRGLQAGDARVSREDLHEGDGVVEVAQLPAFLQMGGGEWSGEERSSPLRLCTDRARRGGRRDCDTALGRKSKDVGSSVCRKG